MNSRITSFVWLSFVLLLLLLVRMGHLQLVERSKWQELALANKEFASRTPRKRAEIKDRFGGPLVVNDWHYYEIENNTALFGKTRLISPEEGKALLATNSASLLPTIRRWYPLGPVLAPVIGYVGSITVEELQANPDLTPTDLVGKQGLEAQFDTQLRGGMGEETFEISALGSKQRLLRTAPAPSGKTVQTTLDPYLSAVAYEALGDNKGAVVIADAKTGAILALVSAPAFDPNVMTDKLADPKQEESRKRVVQDQLLDPRQQFFNRATGGAYPPGSIFKLVTALAGLSTGKITSETEFIDEGVLKVGEFSYANWYFTQFGRTEGAISLRRAIARSNDIYFYKAAEAAGPESIAAMARQIGFGRPIGVGIPGEQAGLVPDPEWKETTRGERWFLGNTYHYGIGQGDLLVTPVQSAQMVQTMINMGVRCSLHLAAGSTVDCLNLGINDYDLGLVLAGMEDACTTGGTAFPFFQWNEAIRQEGLSFEEQLANGAVACKTGTAEFGATDERGYKKTHGWFVMGIGIGKILEKQATLANDVATASATIQTDLLATTSAALAGYTNHATWLKKVDLQSNYPHTLAISVLVESDDKRPYREGSADAGLVAKSIVEWIAGQ